MKIKNWFAIGLPMLNFFKRPTKKF